MKAFVDISVLVAAFYGDHAHHGASINVLRRFKKTEMACGAHSLAEVYAVLTGMPGRNKAATHEAVFFLNELKDRLTVVALDTDGYFAVIEQLSCKGIAGAAIYDALLGHCALKFGAEALFTWNVRDFGRLFPDKPGWV